MPYAALDRRDRLIVNKLAAILRIANALDAEHLQKVKDVRLLRSDATWILEVDGDGDLTMEQLAATARADMFIETFGRALDHPADRRAVMSGRADQPVHQPRAVVARVQRARARRSAGSGTPLLERLKFVAIVASNLDEFFMVRVAGLQHAVADGDDTPDLPGLTPSQQLAAVATRAHALVDSLYRLTTDDLMPAWIRRACESLPGRTSGAPTRRRSARSSGSRSCRW